LNISDTDEFIDILEDSFGRELKYLGKRYGSGRWKMRFTYLILRLLQKIFGNIQDVPDILAYYENGKVLGITKLIPHNSRKDHWYSEITAVRKNIQKKGIGTALKEYTVTHYAGKARRLFGNVREENAAMLKTNERAGYKPYAKKVLLTKKAPTDSGREEIEGFRHFKNDEKGVYDLYLRRTPENVARIEDKIPEDFGCGTLAKLLSLWGRIRGEEQKKFVIERDGKICAYLYFEKLWSHFENLDILLDPETEDLSDSVKCIVSMVSPDRNVISYVPEYRDFERKTLLNAGFKLEEVYICMVVECEGD